jgi:UDPglucose--hexose-1-phosphate uridylyltransferase
VSELRQDPATGAWVIVAPERGGRPRSGRGSERASAPVLAYDPSCPFCPGNERLLARIIEETESPEPPGWCVRVVPNKYPAVGPESGSSPVAAGHGTALAGYGFHEVIIDSPRHDLDLPMLSDDGLAAAIGAYRRRCAELSARPGIECVVVFRNHGPRAGASLSHPHAQAIALGLVPPDLAAKAAWARDRFERGGRCAACDALERELEDGRRVVEATDDFLTVVPFAATTPFEQWIIPRRHRASFAAAEPDELVALGPVLKGALRRLAGALDDPPYNLAVDTAPAGQGATAWLHWSIRILPGMVTPGGFELATGLPINPSRPEDDAAALRRAAVVAGGGGRRGRDPI